MVGQMYVYNGLHRRDAIAVVQPRRGRMGVLIETVSFETDSRRLDDASNCVTAALI